MLLYKPEYTHTPSVEFKIKNDRKIIEDFILSFDGDIHDIHDIYDYIEEIILIINSYYICKLSGRDLLLFDKLYRNNYVEINRKYNTVSVPFAYISNINLFLLYFSDVWVSVKLKYQPINSILRVVTQNITSEKIKNHSDFTIYRYY